MSSQYFPSYKNKGEISVKLDLSNYAPKSDLKYLNADTKSFALKINLADLKTKVDKLQNTSTNLKRFKTMFLKKQMLQLLFQEMNTILLLQNLIIHLLK